MPFYNEAPHRVRITGHERGETSRKRTPYLQVNFTVESEVDADGQSQPVTEYDRNVRIWLTAQSKRFRDAELAALGVESVADVGDVVGTQQTAYCSHQDGYEAWSFVKPKRDKSQRKKPKTRRRPVQVPIEDDDCPF